MLGATGSSAATDRISVHILGRYYYLYSLKFSIIITIVIIQMDVRKKQKKLIVLCVSRRLPSSNRGSCRKSYRAVGLYWAIVGSWPPLIAWLRKYKIWTRFLTACARSELRCALCKITRHPTWLSPK